MANTFNPAIIYKPIIDEYYTKHDTTNVFEGTADYIGNGEYKVLKIEAGGLGDYTRHRQASDVSFASNDVATNWETIKSDKERSTTIQMDKMDNLEAFKLAFDGAIKRFLQKALVERQARRHAAIASKEGVNKVAKTLTTGEEVIKAIREIADYFDDNGVPEEERVLIIRTNLKSMIEDMDNYKSKAVLDTFGTVCKARSEVMNTKINLSPVNGFTVADDSEEIALMGVQKDAVATGNYYEVQYFDENQVQDFLGSKFNYFEKPLNAYVYDNKVDGVYVVTMNSEG